MGIIYHLCCENCKIALDLNKAYGCTKGEDIHPLRNYTCQKIEWKGLIPYLSPLTLKLLQDFLDKHDDYDGEHSLFITADYGTEPWDIERGWQVIDWDNDGNVTIEDDKKRDEYWIPLGCRWRDGYGYEYLSSQP